MGNLKREIAKTQEDLRRHDEDMLKITRTLQKQIDEKNETIDKINRKIKQIEDDFSLEQARLGDNFRNTQDNLKKHQE